MTRGRKSRDTVSLIYINAVAKIDTIVAPSRHPFLLNKMVAPQRSMVEHGVYSSLFSVLLYARSTDCFKHTSLLFIAYRQSNLARC
jgi:hypothetical protein